VALIAGGCQNSGVARRLLAIGLIAGLLAGCSGGGDDPKPTPSPSVVSTPRTTASSPSPSPSRTGPLTTGPNVRPGEKPPTVPPQGYQHNELGALQIAGFYYKAFDWTIATNDDYLIREVSTPGCRACQLVYQALARLRAHHEVQLGGRIAVKAVRLETVRYAAKYDYAFRVTYSQSPVVIKSAQGSTRTTSAGEPRAASLVFVVWSVNRWRIANVTST
jgi:hypothetical protein